MHGHRAEAGEEAGPRSEAGAVEKVSIVFCEGKRGNDEVH